MIVYSGKHKKGDRKLGDCGEATPLIDLFGKDLFVGDIVISFLEGEYGVYRLSVVVKDDIEYYVMGLRGVDFMDNENKWRIKKVKDFSEVVEGEKWKAIGFNYKLE